MKKKNLLNEATVRRFMTLASLQPVGASFMKERFDFETELEEEAMPPEEDPMADPMADPAAEMPPEEMSPEEEEMPPEESAAPPELEDFAREVAQSLADAIEQASNGTISVSVEGGEQPGAEEAPMPEEPGAEEAPMPEEPGAEEAPMPMEPEEEEEEELAEDANLVPSITEEEEERIVNEVFKKIAKKILKQKLTSSS